MGAFGTVIPVTGPNNGYLGQVSRTGGGDPFVVSKQANAANAASISFGDAVVVLPDSTGGTYKQFADFIANGGGTNVSCTTATSVTTTVNTPATNLEFIQPGMFVFGPGVPAGTVVTAVNYTAGTITTNKATTASATVNLNFAQFGGFAVREVKTQLATYPYSVGGSQVGSYAPGQLCEAIVRGSISLKILNGTPVSNGSVYIRAILNTGTYPNGIVGGLEAISDTVNNILISAPLASVATFKTGTLDANSISEVTILSRIAA